MHFEMPVYAPPDLLSEPFLSTPDATLVPVAKSGVAPDYFHANTIFPEYFKIEGTWVLAEESRMDCVTVAVPPKKAGKDSGSWTLAVTEFRRLQIGDRVVTGRTEDATEGIYVHTKGFQNEKAGTEAFTFRTGRSRETSYSRDYDKLYDLLVHEKDHGRVVWVLGPAAVFDSDSRKALVSLIEKGYVHAIFAGNALATHDMEGAFFSTALGQNIYTQESHPNGHYNHLDVINAARRAGSLIALQAEGRIDGGVVDACLRCNIPLILAGSIRDDGPLPGVIADVYAAQDAMRHEIRTATTVLGLATQLHSIATGNMTPSYRLLDGKIRPVYIYSVDISEFAVNKLRDRGTLEVTSIVTNIQDFLVNLERNLK